MILVPGLDEDVAYEEIQSLCNHKTSRYSAIGSIKRPILVMSFEENAGINGINLNNISVVDISEESIEEEMEMSPTRRTSKVVVIRSYAIKVTYCWFHFLEKVKSSLFGYGRDDISILTDLKDILVCH